MVNRFQVLGNLTHTPEQVQTAAGTPFRLLRIATERFVGGQKRTDYHVMTAWSPQTQAAVAPLSVGDRVFVDGRIASWFPTHDDGTRARSVRLVAVRVIPLDAAGSPVQPETISELEPAGRFIDAEDAQTPPGPAEDSQ